MNGCRKRGHVCVSRGHDAPGFCQRYGRFQIEAFVGQVDLLKHLCGDVRRVKFPAGKPHPDDAKQQE